MKHLKGPLTQKDINNLRVGEEVSFSGVIYTARDQAHKRIAEMIQSGKKLPFEIKGQIIYYCGPNPTPPGKVIGSCGPTTSSRMDKFTPLLLRSGLLGMIGKGERSPEVIAAIKKNNAVYFATCAGCGALLTKFIKKNELVCFKELGAEAVYALSVENFPLTVAIDPRGGNLYEQVK